MELKKAISLAVLILGCAACEFDESRNKVDKWRCRGAVKGVCTLTADQERVVALCQYNEAGELTPRLRCFNAVNGQLIAVAPYELPGQLTVKAVAPDFDETDVFWTLHDNGLRVKWAENFAILGYEMPIPLNLFPDTIRRDYYDMDVGADGTVYIVCEDEVAVGGDKTYLYRKRPGNQWERGMALDADGSPLMFKTCRVDHDDFSGKTLVLNMESCKVIRFNGLTPIGVVELPPALGRDMYGYTDIATFGSYMTVSTYSLGPDGGGMLYEIGVISGEVIDERPFRRPEALAIKAPLLPGQPQEVSVFVTGRDDSNGKFGMVELTLVPAD